MCYWRESHSLLETVDHSVEAMQGRQHDKTVQLHEEQEDCPPT